MDEHKDSLLKSLIPELAITSFKDESDEKIKFYVDKLHEIYKDDYRHFYSSIFAGISQNTEEQNSNLAQNIGYICNFIQKSKDEQNFKKSVEKLYDHINLEVAHCSFFLGEANKTSIDKKIMELQAAVDDAREKLQKTQAEYITILGIFASIVLAFVGGSVFSTSVLSNMDKVSLSRLLLIVGLLGGVLTNTIYMLLSFLLKINGKELQAFNIRHFNVLWFLAIITLLLSVKGFASFPSFLKKIFLS